MRLIKTPLQDAYLLDLTPHQDERGYFMRTYAPEDFQPLGLETSLAQIALSFNKEKGTVRGLHFQLAPMAEAKVVRCVRGAMYDVIVDLRKDSSTYCRWHAFELVPHKFEALYVPKGFAHGYQTLADDTEILYQISTAYSPAHYRGIRWSDPAFNIKWPLPISSIAERDNTYPDFQK